MSDDHNQAINVADQVIDYLIARTAEGNRARVIVDRLQQLHAPVARSEPTPMRCTSCVAGYDPKTGELVYAAWPCATAAIIREAAST